LLNILKAGGKAPQSLTVSHFLKISISLVIQVNFTH